MRSGSTAARSAPEGRSPPDYRGAGDVLHRHKVPVGTLKKGDWNEIAVRVYTPPEAGPGGFQGEAPFIMNYFVECILEGNWEYRPGGQYTPGGSVATKPETAAFSVFRESNRVLGRTEQVHGASLSPAESLSRMKPGASSRSTCSCTSRSSRSRSTSASTSAGGSGWRSPASIPIPRASA